MGSSWEGVGESDEINVRGRGLKEVAVGSQVHNHRLLVVCHGWGMRGEK